MNKQTILVIDDEAEIRRLLEINLEANGYKVITAQSGKEGLLLASNQNPDLIILDIGLPDINGHQVLRDLRTWYTRSVIILSVVNEESQIVNALDGGATDYLVKPFRTGELLARIRCGIRRNEVINNRSVIVSGDLSIDLDLRVVKKNEEVIKLTNTEYNLFSLLIRNEGKVLTHQFILKEVWGNGFQNDIQYLRVFIGTLRKKIEEDKGKSPRIINESGIGYRFL
jgi:two-component system, OmpR family, KDP operon response regulator KdpE